MQKPSILILGAGGFIGSAFARHAKTAGASLSCLVHDTPLPEDLREELTHHGSLLTFPWRKLESDPPHMIFHFARIPGRGPYGRRVSATISAFANRRLLTWLSRQTSPPKLVLVAGTLAYGDNQAKAVTEDHPLSPTGFAREYAIGERPIIEAARMKKLPIQVMRPAWVYGPTSWLRGFYLLPMLHRKVVPVYGNGENWMSLIHVQDAAGLMYHLAWQAPVHQTYNLVSGEPILQNDFVRLLSQVSGLPIDRVTRATYSPKDPAIWESIAFSQRTATNHAGLYQKYTFQHPDLNTSLAQIWQQIQS